MGHRSAGRGGLQRLALAALALALSICDAATTSSATATQTASPSLTATVSGSPSVTSTFSSSSSVTASRASTSSYTASRSFTATATGEPTITRWPVSASVGAAPSASPTPAALSLSVSIALQGGNEATVRADDGLIGALLREAVAQAAGIPARLVRVDSITTRTGASNTTRPLTSDNVINSRSITSATLRRELLDATACKPTTQVASGSTAAMSLFLAVPAPVVRGLGATSMEGAVQALLTRLRQRLTSQTAGVQLLARWDKCTGRDASANLRSVTLLDYTDLTIEVPTPRELSKGETAGLAVGCAAAGILFLAAAVLGSRRNPAAAAAGKTSKGLKVDTSSSKAPASASDSDAASAPAHSAAPTVPPTPAPVAAASASAPSAEGQDGVTAVAVGSPQSPDEEALEASPFRVHLEADTLMSKFDDDEELIYPDEGSGSGQDAQRMPGQITGPDAVAVALNFAPGAVSEGGQA